MIVINVEITRMDDNLLFGIAAVVPRLDAQSGSAREGYEQAALCAVGTHGPDGTFKFPFVVVGRTNGFNEVVVLAPNEVGGDIDLGQAFDGRDSFRFASESEVQVHDAVAVGSVEFLCVVPGFSVGDAVLSEGAACCLIPIIDRHLAQSDFNVIKRVATLWRFD